MLAWSVFNDTAVYTISDDLNLLFMHVARSARSLLSSGLIDGQTMAMPWQPRDFLGFLEHLGSMVLMKGLS